MAEDGPRPEGDGDGPQKTVARSGRGPLLCALLLACLFLPVPESLWILLQTGSSESTRVLFVGNSFTFFHDLPGMITALSVGGKTPRPIRAEMVIAPNETLEGHWRTGKALSRIREGDWDWVILQEQTGRIHHAPSRMLASARQFAAAIHKAGARPLLFQTWADRLRQGDQEAIHTRYAEVAAAIDADVVPVGDVWAKALDQDPLLPLHGPDGHHPSQTGVYLAACTFVTALSGVAPRGLPTRAIRRPSALWQIPWPESRPLVDLAVAKRLWGAVACVVPVADEG